MALRTSWLARPPTAAANGGRVPLAVLDRQRTNSAFTEVWKERREEGKWDVKISVRLQLFFQRGASLQVQEYENMRNEKKKEKHSLCSWELHSLLRLASVKPQHPVNTWWHQSETAHNWTCHISTTSHTENRSQYKWYPQVQLNNREYSSRLKSKEIFCLPDVGESTVLLLEGVQSQHGCMDL